MCFAFSFRCQNVAALLICDIGLHIVIIFPFLQSTNKWKYLFILLYGIYIFILLHLYFEVPLYVYLLIHDLLTVTVSFFEVPIRGSSVHFIITMWSAYRCCFFELSIHDMDLNMRIISNFHSLELSWYSDFLYWILIERLNMILAKNCVSKSTKRHLLYL